jgi:hypothetical protein
MGDDSIDTVILDIDTGCHFTLRLALAPAAAAAGAGLTAGARPPTAATRAGRRCHAPPR